MLIYYLFTTYLFIYTMCDKTHPIPYVYFIKNHKLHKQLTKLGIIQYKILK